jgi:putative endonuclease
MTNDLYERVYEHKNHVNPKSFTAQYQIHDLVYYEEFKYAGDAVDREIQLKGGSRKKKLDLIEQMNPEWKDLANDWYEVDKTN